MAEAGDGGLDTGVRLGVVKARGDVGVGVLISISIMEGRGLSDKLRGGTDFFEAPWLVVTADDGGGETSSSSRYVKFIPLSCNNYHLQQSVCILYI